jgi:mono/diheme cytochrome c family protein
MLSGLLLACGGESENPNFPAKGAAKAAMSAGPNGEKIFKIHCVACHGVKGDMGVNGAANLVESMLPLSERIQTVTHGRIEKGMTPYKGILSPEEIKAVAEYTMKFNPNL